MFDSKENFKFDLGVKGLTNSGLISVYRYKEYHLRFPDPPEVMFRTPFKQEENQRNSSEKLCGHLTWFWSVTADRTALHHNQSYPDHRKPITKPTSTGQHS